MIELLGIYSNISVNPTPDRKIKYFGCQKGNFLGAFWIAYNQHGEITISPDDIWIQILKGFSQHVNINSQKLKHLLVNFEGIKQIQNSYKGKKELSIYLDEFTMEGALNEFQKAIEAQTKPAVAEILKGNFSTTGLIEQFVSQIALMETCKQFFKYKCYTLCGLTKINLLGTLEDWELLKKKLQSLKQFDCEWWIKELEIVIEQFIQTYNEKVDYDFWDKIFTYKGATHGSGMQALGWFMAFYPYFNKEKNNWFSYKDHTVEISDFQDNCFKVPFELDDNPCLLMAGFSGIYQLDNNFRLQLSAAFASTKSRTKKQPMAKKS